MIDIPPDMNQALLEAPKARARFGALPPSHKAEYLKWIEEAKKPATRARRIAQAVARLNAEVPAPA
jgi:uncharacterized protein YdeI (YjbR/CyaY-like superfamily)